MTTATETKELPAAAYVESPAESNGSLLDQAIENTASRIQRSYDKLPDPIVAAEKIGTWLHGAGIAKTPNEGTILAFTALTRGVDVIEFVSEHQVVMGKVTRDYDLLLADLREYGEDYTWTDTGEDQEKATLEWTWKGRSYSYTFTADMARQAGLIKEDKPDSNWMAWRPNMLRSKVVRQGFKMYCPELIRGFTTPEDAEDLGEIRKQENGQKPKTTRTRKPKKKTAEETTTTKVGSETTTSSPPPPATLIAPAIETDIEPTVEPAFTTNEQLSRIVELAGQIDNGETGQPFTAVEVKSQIKANYNCEPHELPAEKAAEMIDRFEQFIAEKSQSAA